MGFLWWRWLFLEFLRCFEAFIEKVSHRLDEAPSYLADPIVLCTLRVLFVWWVSAVAAYPGEMRSSTIARGHWRFTEGYAEGIDDIGGSGLSRSSLRQAVRRGQFRTIREPSLFFQVFSHHVPGIIHKVVRQVLSCFLRSATHSAILTLSVSDSTTPATDCSTTDIPRAPRAGN